MLLVFFVLNFLRGANAGPIEVTAFRYQDNASQVLVQVPLGKTVTLRCRSNDLSHFFLYWHFSEGNKIVGPGNDNNYDPSKYKYEVLSGNLTIRGVSKNEEGSYNCVSRGVINNDYNIRSTRMIVQQQWEEVYEHDPGVNLFRVLIIIGTLIVITGIGYVVYRIWKDRYRHPAYLVPSDEEEESGDEIFTAPSTSRPTGNIVKSNSTDSFEKPGISTDFESILDNSNNK